jgi:hypothetical protein
MLAESQFCYSYAFDPAPLFLARALPSFSSQWWPFCYSLGATND